MAISSKGESLNRFLSNVEFSMFSGSEREFFDCLCVVVENVGSPFVDGDVLTVRSSEREDVKPPRKDVEVPGASSVDENDRVAPSLRVPDLKDSCVCRI